MKVKRRKEKYNPYILNDNNIIFKDVKGIEHRVLINDEIYNLFNSFELQDLKYMNEYDRHIEHLEQTDEMLYHNTKNQYDSLEDNVIKKIICEEIHSEIEKLPELQKRRLKMYFFENMSLKEIANKEKCSFQAISYSIDIALKKLKRNLEKIKN